MHGAVEPHQIIKPILFVMTCKAFKTKAVVTKHARKLFVDFLTTKQEHIETNLIPTHAVSLHYTRAPRLQMRAWMAMTYVYICKYVVSILLDVRTA